MEDLLNYLIELRHCHELVINGEINSKKNAVNMAKNLAISLIHDNQNNGCRTKRKIYDKWFIKTSLVSFEGDLKKIEAEVKSSTERKMSERLHRLKEEYQAVYKEIESGKLSEIPTPSGKKGVFHVVRTNNWGLTTGKNRKDGRAGDTSTIAKLEKLARAGLYSEQNFCAYNGPSLHSMIGGNSSDAKYIMVYLSKRIAREPQCEIMEQKTLYVLYVTITDLKDKYKIQSLLPNNWRTFLYIIYYFEKSTKGKLTYTSDSRKKYGHLSLDNNDIGMEEYGIRIEGALQKVLVNRYERDRKLRVACIEKKGNKCCVCGFDFETVYGDIGKGYIHIHHLTPLSEIKNEHMLHLTI